MLPVDQLAFDRGGFIDRFALFGGWDGVVFVHDLEHGRDISQGVFEGFEAAAFFKPCPERVVQRFNAWRVLGCPNAGSGHGVAVHVNNAVTRGGFCGLKVGGLARLADFLERLNV